MNVRVSLPIAPCWGGRDACAIQSAVDCSANRSVTECTASPPSSWGGGSASMRAAPDVVLIVLTWASITALNRGQMHTSSLCQNPAIASSPAPAASATARACCASSPPAPSASPLACGASPARDATDARASWITATRSSSPTGSAIRATS
eukprot:CAMPEP_0180379390 /NCGR_PEP_ID=MMETSP0989-20121125/25320_1 /TAXON_ID=697907 /ORGANISM="non described non described, Strain CCMP2293" /LENGTH=149 /DNA_ID=CAMNT_0022378463 /DNA_START=332 /DNA_END=778 /DNA_ORIENTATION=+